MEITKSTAAPPRVMLQDHSDLWTRLAFSCREDPGAWHIIHDVNSAYGTHIKNGKPKIFGPPGSFETTMRETYKGATGARMGTLWVRYVGTEDSPDAE